MTEHAVAGSIFGNGRFCPLGVIISRLMERGTLWGTAETSDKGCPSKNSAKMAIELELETLSLSRQTMPYDNDNSKILLRHETFNNYLHCTRHVNVNVSKYFDKF